MIPVPAQTRHRPARHARRAGALSRLLAAFLAGAAAACAGAGEPGVELGPLYHEFRLTLEPGRREEALGPFFYRQELEAPRNVTRVWAVPPLVSYLWNDDVDYEQFDILWKLLTYNRYGVESRFQILQWFSFAGGGTQSETNVSRFTLFPIYFQQRSAIPEKNYTALFPLYGEIQGRFFRADIRFALFPLYAQTRRQDMVTDNILYPFFHVRRGNGLQGWHVWPLLGRDRKEVTLVTNQWNEPVTVPGHDKTFALWPIYWNHHTELGTTNENRQRAVLPFYSYQESARRRSVSAPWPLGFTHTVDEDKRFEEWGAPWPLVVFARGEGKRTDRIFPFYSSATNATQTSAWVFWPLWKYNRLRSAPLDRERTRMLLFLYSDVSARNLDSGQRQRQRDLWPLATVREEFDGRRRTQVLSLIEPFLPNNGGVQRNLSPLWSLWRDEVNPGAGTRSQSLLWNLYRQDSAPEGKKCSLLFGLVRYQSASAGPRWRVLFVPFGKAAAPAPAPAATPAGNDQP
ncbi:MAG: hypothetical protein RJA22_1041 [Verrucomicrobiota bacterium]|jgi:hypothetical protein